MLGGTIALQGQNMSPKIAILVIFGPKNGPTKVEFEGVGPIWRDPRRNPVQKAVPGIPYGGMATHLVTKRCDLGCLGVPGQASTPLDPAIQAGSKMGYEVGTKMVPR